MMYVAVSQPIAGRSAAVATRFDFGRPFHPTTRITSLTRAGASSQAPHTFGTAPWPFLLRYPEMSLNGRATALISRSQPRPVCPQTGQ